MSESADKLSTEVSSVLGIVTKLSIGIDTKRHFLKLYPFCGIVLSLFYSMTT